MLVVDGRTVLELLPMADCIEVMATCMRAVSEGRTVSPPRLLVPLYDDSGSFLLKPSSLSDPPAYGAKIVTVHPQNATAGRPVIQGLVVLFDHHTGAPVGAVDAAAITAVRTAAVSGLATRLLARADAKNHGIFGAGVQAAVHLDAVIAARSGIDRVVVWARSHERAEAFAAEHAARTKRSVVATRNPQEAGACDVVSTVTSSDEPVLHGAWLTPGAHVNLVGAYRPTVREADTEVIVRSKVFVDSLQSALREPGDLLIPISEGAFAADRIAGEIGQLVAGTVAGRENDAQITLFKSLGHAAQDIYAAHAVHQRALSQGRGVNAEI